MIGVRAVVSAVLAVSGIVAVVGPGGPDPSVGLEADRLVAERAEAAEAALAALERALEPALESARRGAARIVSGDEPPSPRLRDAAETLAGTQPEVRRATTAVEALEATRRARDPAVGPPLEPPIREGELPSIALQLEASAAAGDAFAGMRARASGLAGHLDRALAALEAGDRSTAEDAIRTARRDHATIEAWKVDFVTLPVWIETTDAMIRSVEVIIEATAVGDVERAAVAAEDFAARSADAAFADRALRIAISEGGSAVAAAPLARLAAALARVRAARAEMAAILQAAGR
jgi:hypothetical protein